MKEEIQKRLKSCCKDEASYEKLKQLFSELNGKAEKYRNYLELLERSIRNDYDSILITKLELDKPGPVIVYVNDGFTRMTGFSREEVIGKTPRILQGEKTDRAVLDRLKERLKSGKPFFGHTVNYRKDGSEFVNQWDIHPLTDDNGNVTHWVSYQHDITERKRSEQQLLDAEKEFDDLQEEAKSTIADLDASGHFRSGNKAFRKLTGYDTEELKKIKFWELLGDSYIEEFRKKFDTFKPSDFANKTYELTLVSRDGEEVEVLAKTKLLGDDGQYIVRVKFSNRSLEKRIVQLLQRQSDYERILDKQTDFGYKAVKKSGEGYVYTTITDSFSNITGFHSEDIVGAPVYKFIAKEDRAKVEKHLETVMEGKSSTEIYNVRTRSGQTIPVIDSTNPVQDKNGDVKAVKGSVSLEISSENSIN